MSAIFEYQHKKFTSKTEEYSHKKFGMHMKKRKHDDMQEKENVITAETILEMAQKDIQPEQPQAKRRQTLFRPWLDEDSNKSEDNSKVNSDELPKSTVPPQVLTSIPTNVMTYRPAKPRTDKEQQRSNRITLAYLTNRRRQLAQQLMLHQHYVAQQQQQVAMMEQSATGALYLRHLQQLALQRQHQLFVFGN